MKAILQVGILGAVLALASLPSVAVRAGTPMVLALGILAFPGETPYTATQRAAISAAIDRVTLSKSAAELGPSFQATPAYSFLYGLGKQSDLVTRAPESMTADFPFLVVLRGWDDRSLAILIAKNLTSAGMPAGVLTAKNLDEAMKFRPGAPGGGKAYLTNFGPDQPVHPILLLGGLAQNLLPKLKANTERTDGLGALLTDRVSWAFGPEALEKPATELNNILMEDAHIIPLFWLVPR